MANPITIIAEVQAGHDLEHATMLGAMDQLMQGFWTDPEIADFLLALASKGESAVELAAAAQVLRQHMTCIQHRYPHVLDTCGTGGDGTSTFNISTAAAVVVAAAGVPVAKHGNRSVSSTSGSADVLRVLGVGVDADLATVERCLDRLGICFCFAPLWHPSVRHVAAVRKKLAVPTLFNWIGPLCNPARAHHQVLGVGRSTLRPKLAAALKTLGTLRSAVVHGDDGLDEVTLATTTSVTLIEGDEVSEQKWSAEILGLPTSPLEALRTSGADASAALILGVLRGDPGPARDIVVANAGAAIWIAQGTSDARESVALRECVDRARRVLVDGSAADLLQRLVVESN